MAKRVKEMYSYVCPDLAKEFAKFDAKPDKYFKTFQGIKVSIRIQCVVFALRGCCSYVCLLRAKSLEGQFDV